MAERLTDIETTELVVLVGARLKEWQDCKASKQAYEFAPFLIDHKIERLTALHSKLERMMTAI